MKKMIISIAAVFALCGVAAAQQVAVAEVEALPGETVSLTMMINTSGGSFTGLEFDIQFPLAGFSTTGKAVNTISDWDGAFTIGDVGGVGIDNLARCALMSYSDTPIPGTGQQALGTVEFIVNEAVPIGEYTVILKNMTLIGNGRSPVADTSFTLSVVNTHTVILNETSTVMPLTADGVNVVVKRTINANSWSTICLPFAMTEEQVTSAFGTDVELADFTSWSSEEDDDGNIVAISVGFTDVTEIEANHPYIIKVKNAITEFTANGVDIEVEEEPSVMVGKKKAERGYMIGNYVAGTTIPENDLFLNGSKFWYSKGLSTMKAFRAYFEFADVLTNVEEAGARIVLSFPDEPTGIDAMSKHIDYDGQTYNLLGEKVTDTLRKGIYIRDGKKMVVK